MLPLLVITMPQARLNLGGPNRPNVLDLEAHGRKIEAVKAAFAMQGITFLSHQAQSYSVVEGKFYQVGETITFGFPEIASVDFSGGTYLLIDSHLDSRPFRFRAKPFKNASDFYFEQGLEPPLPSAFHTDGKWANRLLQGSTHHTPPSGGRERVPEQNAQTEGVTFVLNPFVIQISPQGQAIRCERLKSGDVDASSNLLRILDPGGIRALLPLLDNNDHDLRWRFLCHLWGKLDKHRLQDWPAAFRLFFAPFDEREERAPVDPESFFVLDLLGGAFVIKGHGTGYPKYDWIPPEGMTTNHNWIATRFYRRWKGLSDGDGQHHLQWLFADREPLSQSNDLHQLPIAETGVPRREAHGSRIGDIDLAQLLRRVEDIVAKEFAEIIARLDSWKNFHVDHGYIQEGQLRETDLLEALASAALPKSPIRVEFPSRAETFAAPVAYDMIGSRHRGAIEWARELVLGAVGVVSSDDQTHSNRFLDNNAPRHRGYGWWHDWASWLSTKPYDLRYPGISTALRLDDPLTPLGVGTLASGTLDAESGTHAPANLNRKPVFW
jgi:hypothetical protein